MARNVEELFPHAHQHVPVPHCSAYLHIIYVLSLMMIIGQCNITLPVNTSKPIFTFAQTQL
jgi:hypothetical protein